MDLGVHVAHFIVNVTHFIVKGHGSGLAGLMVLERNCLWAVSSLFAPDGLERRSRHDIWASNELCSFCRLCCWGPGSCRSIHTRVFSVTGASHPLDGAGALFVVEELGTCSLTLRGHADLWLCGLCQTVLFVVSWSSTSSLSGSDVY